jgi:hypothetical protein
LEFVQNKLPATAEAVVSASMESDLLDPAWPSNSQQPAFLEPLGLHYSPSMRAPEALTAARQLIEKHG